METIFDHNPTAEEIISHFGREITKEEHLLRPFSQETEYAKIYCLYKHRGDQKMAAKYRALLPPDFLHDVVDLNDMIAPPKKP